MQLQLTASPRTLLQMLLGLRGVAVLGQSLSIAIAGRWLHLSLPLELMTLALLALAATALLSALRLRSALPATQLEITAQLLVDVAQLSAMLYLSGGTTNPFTSLLLLPVAFAAAALAWRYLACITLACLGSYVWLIDHNRPLMLMHTNPMAAFDLHMLGMHVTFVLSTALLAGALSLMAAQMRRGAQAVAELREAAMRREHLSAMGLLAAGAAHELSTPLFSMAMLVEELRGTHSIDRQFHADLGLLGRQIQLCKERLGTLLRGAGADGAPATQRAPVRQLLQQIIDGWSTVRPGVRLAVDWQALTEAALLDVDEGFSQALTSLLDNAADASAARGSEQIALSFRHTEQGLQILIDDDGAGLNATSRQRAGKAVFSTKPGGFGLGLALSHANLNRLNGQVTLTSRAEGGTRTIITMPTLQAHHAG